MFVNCRDHGVPGIEQELVIFDIFIIFNYCSRIWPAVHQTHFPSFLSTHLDYILQTSILVGVAMDCLGQWNVVGRDRYHFQAWPIKASCGILHSFPSMLLDGVTLEIMG